MPIFESIVTTLGFSIAKATLKCWLKDADLARDTATDLLGLINKRFDGYRERASAQRSFNRLAEKAAESLSYIFEREFRSVDDAGRTSVVHEVSDSINQVEIDTKFLAAINLDPQHLFSAIRSRANLRLFQVSEAEMFDRILSESCSLIVDFSSNLPGFTERTLGEILTREEIIIQKLDQVVEQVQKVRDATSGTNSRGTDARFEESYRRQVSRKLDEIELFGASELFSPGSKRHHLTLAYISLKASRRSTSGAHGAHTETTASGGPFEQPAIGPVSSIEAALCNESKVLVRGEAGSGKTTLLQFVAVRSATGTFEGALEVLNASIPFFIRLREFAERPLPRPEEFPGMLAPLIAGTMPSGWVHNVLVEGSGLILIDGVDELDETKRATVHEWIRDLAQEFPDSRFVITSRPAAIKGAWLSSEGFSEVELLALQPPEIDVFIDHWHEAVATEETDPEKKVQIPADGQLLKSRIRDDRSLRELATSPLLCGMICAMHKERRHALPSSRIALYEAALAMLLHRRDQERRIVFSEIPNIELEEKQSLLQELSMWLMDNGWVSAPEDRAAEKIQSILPAFPRIPRTLDGATVLKALIQRSGILRSPVEGVIDFVHKTFQEFLCAKAIVQADRLPYLLDRAVQERWRDVAVLAAGLGSEMRREEFIKGLLSKGDALHSRQTVYYLLAVACMEAAVRLSPGLQTEIVRRIERLHPPQNISEAKALSRAGDLALSLLKAYHGQRATCAAACVRALRLIGSERAFEALRDYGGDERVTVTEEIVESWPYFDSERYAREVLANSTGLRGSIAIGPNQNSRGLGYLRKISDLSISVGPRTAIQECLSEAATLHQLRSLRIYGIGQRLSDLSFLSTLTNLVRLVVEIGLERATGLDFLPKLRSLHMIDVGEGALEIIRALPELRDLTLRGAISTEFPELRAAGTIEALSLRLNGLRGIDALDRMQSLTRLSIVHNDCADEVAQSISQLLKLRQLTYRPKFGVSNLEFVRSHTLLTVAAIECQADVDLAPLSSCSSLHFLTLSGVKYPKIPAGFSRLTRLSRLSLPNVEWKVAADLDGLPPNLDIVYVPRLAFLQLHDKAFSFRLRPMGAM